MCVWGVGTFEPEPWNLNSMRRWCRVGNAVRNAGAVARSRRNCSVCSLRLGAERANFICGSRKSDLNRGPVSGLARTPCGSRPLLFPHFLERQSSTDRNDIEDGMRRVGWHSQLMNSFPCSNADVRRIELGTLLGKLLASLFCALKFFESEAFGGVYQIACSGYRHMPRGSRGSVASWAPPVTSTGSIALLSLVDPQRAAFEVLAVQRLHGAGSIGVRHFHKTETARAPRVAIGDQGDFLDASMRREQSAHTLLSCREGKISDVEFGHRTLLTIEV